MCYKAHSTSPKLTIAGKFMRVETGQNSLVELLPALPTEVYSFSHCISSPKGPQLDDDVTYFNLGPWRAAQSRQYGPKRPTIWFSIKQLPTLACSVNLYKANCKFQSKCQIKRKPESMCQEDCNGVATPAYASSSAPAKSFSIAGGHAKAACHRFHVWMCLTLAQLPSPLAKLML